jgi:hypothetical protein
LWLGDIGIQTVATLDWSAVRKYQQHLTDANR